MKNIENFDLIVKIDENETRHESNEEVAIEKLKNHLKEPDFYLKECEFDNIFMVELKEKLKNIVNLQKRSIQDDFEMLSIENVILTRPDKILENILSISKKRINKGDTFAVRCNIKGNKFIKKREEFIKSVYKEIEKINGKPDEIHPDWIIHIEVLGENTGISVLKQHI